MNRRDALLAALSGALTVGGFAPFGLFPLPFLTLAWLLRAWRQSPGPAAAAGLGYAWGMGFFLAGVSWVHVSMHDVGGMAAPLAALATVLFCAYLALFPALAGALFRRRDRGGVAAPALLAAATWTLAEWLRGWLLTGFPWLAVGYSQAPPSPLAGYAPILGSYGLAFLTVLAAGLLGFGWRRRGPVVALVALLACGFALRGIAWTQPAGEPLSVSLLQGNIPQTLKWDPERLPLSLETYLRLAERHPAQLTVLPETALPLFFDAVPEEVRRRLTRHGDVLVGVAVRSREGGYTNGAVSLAPDLRASAYAKVHLVPFGEYIPPGFSWFFDLVRIPMSDFSAGPPDQPPLAVAGQRLAPTICYEDLFGEELLRFLPSATLLVNLSNTAWFGRSLAQPQHLQIAQLRSLETGRPMLRATNTGMTAAIAADGTVAAVLEPFTVGALKVQVQGHRGSTPYMHAGNLPVLLISFSVLVGAALRGKNAAPGA
ncbi:MAG: apolipoprotein N-acyltransferase [Rhodocyclaceae bacterium]|nr:apolipoprotein N-acyltransferase [Rhodocyclaceae bacterium]